MPGEAVLAGDVHAAVFGTGRQDDGLRVEQFVVDGEDLDASGEIDRGDVLVADVRAELLGLLGHAPHEVRPLNALGETGEVLDLGRVHERPAGGDRTREDDGLQARSRSVDRRRVARRA